MIPRIRQNTHLCFSLIPPNGICLLLPIQSGAIKELFTRKRFIFPKSQGRASITVRWLPIPAAQLPIIAFCR
jgi:hypothetical protein